ncbi:unnamed protein product [Lymnaea stagnalis]|uniref:Mothers against decapentaplegic homolog n=1 Tax=Lymnaea stagnalis TaxID=6523 RepID=A0AAV2HSM2_LYMST
MFRSKRYSLVKRLWKYKINDETRSSSQKDTSISSSSSPLSPQEDLELKSVTHSLFKKLKEEQLEILLQAMESHGGEITPCVPLSKSDIRLGKHTFAPYVLCCKVFRWPDLKCDAEMKRLPSCSRLNEDKDSVVCCNPFHWSLVVKIDEPPIFPDKHQWPRPPHTQRQDNHADKYQGVSSRIMASSETGFLTSDYTENSSDNTEHNTGQNFMYWCTVAYWELRERVGRLFQVTEPRVHVFQQLPHGNGVCLKLFQKPTNIEAVRRTREKIGFGIILSREAAHKNSMPLTTREVTEECGTAPNPRTLTISSTSQLSMSPQSQSPVSNISSGFFNNSNVTSSTSKSIECFSPSQGTSDSSVNLLDGRESGDDIGCDCDVHRGARRGENLQAKTNCGGNNHLHDLQPDRDPCHPVLSREVINIDPICDETMDFLQTSVTSPSSSPPPHQASQHLQPSSPSSFSSFSSSSSPPSSPPSYYNGDSSFNSLENMSSKYETSSSSVNSSNNNKITNKKRTSSFEITTATATNTIKMTKPSSSKQHSGSQRIVNTTHARGFTPSGGLISDTFHHQGEVWENNSVTDLPYKQGEVWAYNASNFPIFVNSPTLDNPESPKSLVVKKVPPGYSIKIFDYARADLLERTEARSKLRSDGPFDPCSVRISLAKGWGHNYSRQFITSCPCWLEIFLGVRNWNSTS